MIHIRPELAATLYRSREVMAAVLVAGAGLWLFWLGGWLLGPLGAGIMALSAGWGLIALRRLRFFRRGVAPGVVEVDEGQIGYFGPSFGGFVALSELAEIRITLMDGARHWRLKTVAGEVLTIPVEAAGADRLYDAFAALPGVDMARLVAALDAGQETLPLWRRPRPALPSGPRDHEMS